MHKSNGSLLAIEYDVERYLSEGGQLLDLRLPSAREKAEIKVWAETASPEAMERLRRVGEFFGLIGQRGDGLTLMSSAFGEDDLLAMWRETRSAGVS